MSSARIRTMSGWRLGLEVMVREMQFKDTRMSRNKLVEDIFSKFFLTNSQSNIARFVTRRIIRHSIIKLISKFKSISH